MRPGWWWCTRNAGKKCSVGSAGKSTNLSFLPLSNADRQESFFFFCFSSSVVVVHAGVDISPVGTGRQNSRISRTDHHRLHPESQACSHQPFVSAGRSSFFFSQLGFRGMKRAGTGLFITQLGLLLLVGEWKIAEVIWNIWFESLRSLNFKVSLIELEFEDVYNFSKIADILLVLVFFLVFVIKIFFSKSFKKLIIFE